MKISKQQRDKSVVAEDKKVATIKVALEAHYRPPAQETNQP